MMKSVLLITHDTSLSGAPKSILLVFEELKKKGYKICTVAIEGGGNLESRFINLSDHYYRLDTISKKVNYSLKNRFKRFFLNQPILSDYEQFFSRLSNQHFDIIYANTILSLRFAIKIKEIINCSLILHVHELKTVIDEFLPEINMFDNKVDSYIVPSYLNKNCLVEIYGLNSEKINVIREVSNFTLNIGEKISFNTDKTKIMMCGGAYWRKGDDLFIQVANQVLKKDPFYEFYWIGKQSSERKRVNTSDILKLGIEDSVFFIDETDIPEKWYLKADIFILTSREDSFPLAVIEAGMIGLPIICFDKSTGISEVVDSELVVPYLDVEAMAEKILELKLSPNKMDEISKQNKKVFNQFRAENIVSDIVNLLENVK